MEIEIRCQGWEWPGGRRDRGEVRGGPFQGFHWNSREGAKRIDEVHSKALSGNAGRGGIDRPSPTERTENWAEGGDLQIRNRVTETRV